MALINLQTNLKSLKYGDFGTEKPYITKNINNPPNEKGLQKATTHRIDDLRRFRKFLTSGNGAKWVANQAGLNILEAGIKSSGRKSFAGQIISGGWSTTKLIASTAAQIPVNGTGTHFIEGFSGKQGYLKGIQGHVLSRAGAPIITQGILENINNTEVGKRRSKILGKFTTPGTITSYDIKTNKFVSGKTPTKNLIQNIFGGGNPQYKEIEYRTNQQEAAAGLSLGAHTVNEESTKRNVTTTDEGEAIYGNTKFRTGQGFTKSGGDVITVRGPVSGSLKEFGAKLQAEQERLPDFYKGVKDQIKFNIKTVAPRSSNEDGPLITQLDFRAYLESLSDSFKGDWASTNYIGRAEQLYSYSGFSRAIQFSFKVVAHSERELQPLYEKLNKLVGSTAPNYMNQNYMRGTFNMLTIGDYLQDMPGFIESVNLAWSKDYPFATSENAASRELPTVLDVQVSYQPVHRNAPTNDMTFIGREFSLANDTGFSNNTLDESTA